MKRLLWLPLLAHAAFATDWNLNLNAVTPPALPVPSFAGNGTWATDNANGHNRLYTTTTGSVANLELFGYSQSGSTVTFCVEFKNQAAPVTSYIYPGIMTSGSHATDNGYQLVMSRGTGEVGGALVMQRSGGSRLNTPVGTSGTTFEGGKSYCASTTITIAEPNITFAVSVQRQTDSYWLASDGTWGSGQVTAFTVSDTDMFVGQACCNAVSINVSQSVVDSYLYSFSISPQRSADRFAPLISLPFIRQQSTPVIAKGSTYNGWHADALAAPAVTYDGTQYVATVSIWDDARQKWASGFWTSPDLVTWTYLPNSLQSPQGSDYIWGNSGLAWWNSKYWLAYAHYSGGSYEISLAYSTDLLTWTNVADPWSTAGWDAYVDVNPNTSRLEIWYTAGAGGTASLEMWDSPDGTNWTDRGSFALTDVDLTNFGEPTIWYQGTVRYLVHDAGICDGYRMLRMAHSVNSDTTWVVDGTVLVADITSAWEPAETFDSTVIVADIGDGHGSIPRLLYAAGQVNEFTNATQSSIGLASLLGPPAGTSITGSAQTAGSVLIR